MKLTNEDVFEAGTGTFWDVNVCVPLTVVRTGAKLEPGEDEDKRELLDKITKLQGEIAADR